MADPVQLYDTIIVFHIHHKKEGFTSQTSEPSVYQHDLVSVVAEGLQSKLYTTLGRLRKKKKEQENTEIRQAGA